LSKPKEDKDLIIPQELIKELLMPSEIRMVNQRVHIIKLFHEKLTIRAIAAKVGVGTDTVMRVAKTFYTKEVVKNYFKNLSPKSYSSKWVFGQVSPEEK